MTLLEEKRSELENLASEPITWEDTLDGLGLEDFPERDYFLEAGKLLREARGTIRLFKMFAQVCNRPDLNSDGLIKIGDEIADRIDKLLAGEGLL